MFNRKILVVVFKSGFVVLKSCFVFGVLLDVKVVDFGCLFCFGLVEVKCFYIKFYVIFLEVCFDFIFFMEKVSEIECKLKRDYLYYV